MAAGDTLKVVVESVAFDAVIMVRSCPTLPCPALHPSEERFRHRLGSSSFSERVLLNPCFQPIQENSPSVFQWRGAPVYTIAGLRTFGFEASKTTPGTTTFLHAEEHSGLMSFMMSPMVAGSLIKADFDKFNQDLKARVEALSSKS